MNIIQKIANKINGDISELFAVFMAGVSLNREFENVVKSYDFKDNEKEILKDFYKYLRSVLINEKEEFIKNFIEIAKLDKVFKNLALYFIVFIPDDILLSKDAKKIKKSLEFYPDEIKEAIIKSLEMLSLGDTNIDKDLKIEILKEVLNTIIILTFLIRNLNA